MFNVDLYIVLVVLVVSILAIIFVIWIFCRVVVIVLRQKTRSPQQRRMYGGSRPRQSLALPEPTIYVSPSNLPPPPKYEFMAPPSYEEVVGIHYPNYAAQPIAQPISTALAQAQAQGSSHTGFTNNVTVTESAAPASVTVTTEVRRTSEAAAAART